VKAEPVAAAAAGKADTSKPPVRALAVPQKLAKAKPGEAPKQLTKQQINQIAAREKRAAEAAAAAAAASAATAAPAKPQADKKRKHADTAAADSDSSDSDSDSGSDSDSDSDAAEPSAKAAKSSTSATPASASAAAAAAAAKKLPGSNLVDTTGMTEKEAKAAIVEAKRAARKLKAEARLAEEQALGSTHPSQLDLQLMSRDNAAVKLWELFEQDRRDRAAPLTAVEADQIGRLEPQSLAQLPNGHKIEGHSFKLLHKSLKSMYGDQYDAQVRGGTIQPALSTKAERFAKKRERLERKEAGDDKGQYAQPFNVNSALWSAVDSTTVTHLTGLLLSVILCSFV
jgi:hypothetical protein